MYTLGPAPTSTLRTIPFTIPTSAWTESNGIYTATFASVYITETSKEMCTFDESLRNRAKRDINISKTPGGGSITLTTSALPTGAISGTIFTIDADDGKVCMVIEDTVLPIANGGTGANTLAEAKENLGILAIAEQVEELYSKVQPVELWHYTGTITSNACTNGKVFELSEDISHFYKLTFIYIYSETGFIYNADLNLVYAPVTPSEKNCILDCFGGYYAYINIDDNGNPKVINGTSNRPYMLAIYGYRK